jgi:2-polyprenyl-3-methyl-5-hydroxy-6-metoxy-1,4-benzoquinol methylase
MQNSHCPLCKENQSTLAFISNGFELRMCEVCDLNFIHPYLQKEEDRNPLSPEKQLAGEQLSVNSYFKYIAPYFVGIKSHLDIGCGCGGLLKTVENFDQITVRNGVEGDIERAKFAANYANCEVFDHDVFAADDSISYDIITLINVFSHIPNLDDFFEKVKLMLNENGKVIIKTGLFKRGFRKNNLFDWQIPEHVHFIGDRTMEYISEKYKFKMVESIDIPLADELISKDFLLSPGLSSVRNLVKKIIYFTPGLSFLLRKIYTRYTKGKLYAKIIILEKGDV